MLACIVQYCPLLEVLDISGCVAPDDLEEMLSKLNHLKLVFAVGTYQDLKISARVSPLFGCD